MKVTFETLTTLQLDSDELHLVLAGLKHLTHSTTLHPDYQRDAKDLFDAIQTERKAQP